MKYGSIVSDLNHNIVYLIDGLDVMYRFRNILVLSLLAVLPSCLDFTSSTEEKMPPNLGTMSAQIGDVAWTANDYVTAEIDEMSFQVTGEGDVGNLEISLGEFEGPGNYDLGGELALVIWQQSDSRIRISGNTIVIDDKIFAAGVGGGSGEIQIDRSGDRYFGSFHFKASNKDNDELEVTEGEFDFTLPE